MNSQSIRLIMWVSMLAVGLGAGCGGEGPSDFEMDPAEIGEKKEALATAYWVRGTVREAGTGQPIAEARLTATVVAPSNASGNSTAGTLPNGAYLMTLGGGLTAPWTHRITID